MHLNSIALTQFKNYSHFKLNFPERVNCFVGNNGTGKTNLLDAIYYLCIGKSYFNAVEQQNFQTGSQFLRLEGQFLASANETNVVEVIAQKGSKKIIKNNGLAYERVAEHLGFAPVTIIAPDDNVLILGGSEVRRKFLNASLSQHDKTYLFSLLKYNKLLSQRNAVLKSESINETLLNTYDEQMIPLADSIFNRRKAFVESLIPQLMHVHKAISGGEEAVSCMYISQLNNMSFEEKLQRCRERDLILRRSTSGIHRDDLEFLIHEDKPLKKYGSQGQQKSFLLALKLAQFNDLQASAEKEAILLLDDIFDKLDRQRMRQLFKYLFSSKWGQIFMSDTNKERLEQLLSEFDVDFGTFDIQLESQEQNA